MLEVDCRRCYAKILHAQGGFHLQTIFDREGDHYLLMFAAIAIDTVKPLQRVSNWERRLQAHGSIGTKEGYGWNPSIKAPGSSMRSRGAFLCRSND